MNDQEQMDYINEIRPTYKTLDSFRKARKKSWEEALVSRSAEDRLLARVIGEQAWWDAEVPS